MKKQVMAGIYEATKEASRDGVTYTVSGLTFSVKIFVNWERYEEPDSEERFLEALRQAVTAI